MILKPATGSDRLRRALVPQALSDKQTHNLLGLKENQFASLTDSINALRGTWLDYYCCVVANSSVSDFYSHFYEANLPVLVAMTTRGQFIPPPIHVLTQRCRWRTKRYLGLAPPIPDRLFHREALEIQKTRMIERLI